MKNPVSPGRPAEANHRDARKRRVRAGVLAVAAVSLAAIPALALTACGGESADQARLKQEQIDRARAEGARQARIDERTKQDRRETERLRKQVEALRKGKGANRGSANSSPAAGSKSSSATKDCGSGISANAVTSCPFAQMVRDTYVRAGGPSIEVYSPITQKTYTMSCSAGARTVCRGGNNAVVEF